MNPDFKAGDLVQLKSGGPVMTVAYVSPRGKADCKWFVEDMLKSDTFNLPELKLADTQENEGIGHQ